MSDLSRWPLARPVAALAALPLLACGGDATGPADHPVPSLEALSPSSAMSGSGELELEATGSNFIPDSRLLWNGDPRPTEHASGTRLTARIPASDLEDAATIDVSVRNPGPGGGESDVLAFTVQQAPNPEPRLTGLEPSAVGAGHTAASVTLRGEGFVSGSRVSLDGDTLQPTLVSSGELTLQLGEERLASSGRRALAVYNPPPGGGGSDTLELEIRAPEPVVASLSPPVVAAGEQDVTVTVTGSGYLANSVVRVDGVERSYERLGTDSLRVALRDGDVATTGSVSLTVENPGPAGGVSEPRTLSVTTELAVDGMPATGAHSGGTGMSLTIYGDAFSDSTVVLWDGTEVPTSREGPTRVVAALTSGDLAATGEHRVRVWDRAAGGGVSEPLILTVRPPPAGGATEHQTLPLAARDVVADTISGMLYATMPSTDPDYGNAVVEIDPAAGTVERAVFVGSEPTLLAIADDGSRLYVELAGAGAVRQVSLPDLTPGAQISLDGARVDDMEVAPGDPATLVVSRMSPAISPRHLGVSVYESGTLLPESTAGHTGPNTLDFGDEPDVLYGYNNETTSFAFFTLALGPDGVTMTDAQQGVTSGFYARLEHASGRAYFTNGPVVDPELRERVGTLARGGSALLPDPDLGRVFVLERSGISAVDIHTFRLLGEALLADLAAEHPANARRRLVRWGPDGLAFRDGEKIHLLRTPLASE